MVGIQLLLVCFAILEGLCGSTEPELSEYAEEEKLPEAETIEPSFSSLDTAQIADPDPEGIRFSILYVDFAKGKDSNSQC